MCANTDLLMRRDNQIHGTKETYRRSINKSQRESLWERAGAHANHHLFVFLPLLETMHVLARMGPMHTNRERERERKGERARETENDEWLGESWSLESEFEFDNARGAARHRPRTLGI